MEPNSPPSPPIDPEIVRLVDLLGSSLPWMRAAAREALLKRGPAAIEPLLALFEQEQANHRRRARLYKRTAVSLLLGSILSSLLVLVLYFYVSAHIVTTLLGNFAFLAFLITAGYWWIMRLFGQQERTVQALALFDDLRVVGPMAEALEFDSRDVAITALQRLLPRLRPEHAHLLEERQQICLCRAMMTIRVEGFAIAVLQALSHVGTGCALPYVQSLANRKGWGQYGERIREAAQGCMLILEERAAQEQASQTLLRGANKPDTPAEVLLRPAHATPTTEPQQLLRAALVAETSTEERAK